LGTLYIDSIPTRFAGYARFSGNLRTALAAVAASIDFLEDCVANFSFNHGRNGGAIALFGYSFIRVHPGAQLNFIDNLAYFNGGAIFAKSVGEHDLISSRNCFIRFHDITVTPVHWTAKFYFENNTAHGLMPFTPLPSFLAFGEVHMVLLKMTQETHTCFAGIVIGCLMASGALPTLMRQKLLLLNLHILTVNII